MLVLPKVITSQSARKKSAQSNGHAQYDHIHPKIIEATFSFPEFAPACKKSVHSINLFLRYSPYWPKPSLTMPTQKLFV